MTRPPGPNDVGLRLVILYKTVKGAIWLVMAAILAVGLHFGLADELANAIDHVHSHLTRTWSIRLTEKVLVALSLKHLELATIGLTVDGALTSIEAWGLHRRKRWAPWLVVVLTGAFIPLEIYEIVSRPSWLRVSIFVINVVIVVYFVRRIYREHEVHVHPSASDTASTG